MQLSFEPPEGSGDEEGAAQALLQWVQRCGGRNIVALTGAGISTESGACCCHVPPRPAKFVAPALLDGSAPAFESTRPLM